MFFMCIYMLRCRFGQMPMMRVFLNLSSPSQRVNSLTITNMITWHISRKSIMWSFNFFCFLSTNVPMLSRIVVSLWLVMIMSIWRGTQKWKDRDIVWQYHYLWVVLNWSDSWISNQKKWLTKTSTTTDSPYSESQFHKIKRKRLKSADPTVRYRDCVTSFSRKMCFHNRIWWRRLT